MQPSDHKEYEMPQSPLAVGVHEAARLLGISPRTVANLIARGELPSRRIGRRRVIPVALLEAFLKRDHQTGKRKGAVPAGEER
jgi:excisionase family DNA binding protein